MNPSDLRKEASPAPSPALWTTAERDLAHWQHPLSHVRNEITYAVLGVLWAAVAAVCATAWYDVWLVDLLPFPLPFKSTSALLRWPLRLLTAYAALQAFTFLAAVALFLYSTNFQPHPHANEYEHLRSEVGMPKVRGSHPRQTLSSRV